MASLATEAGVSFCHLLWKIVPPPRSEGFLFKVVALFLTKGGEKKTATKTPPLDRRFHGPRCSIELQIDPIESRPCRGRRRTSRSPGRRGRVRFRPFSRATQTGSKTHRVFSRACGVLRLDPPKMASMFLVVSLKKGALKEKPI